MSEYKLKCVFFYCKISEEWEYEYVYNERMITHFYESKWEYLRERWNLVAFDFRDWNSCNNQVAARRSAFSQQYIEKICKII